MWKVFLQKIKNLRLWCSKAFLGNILALSQIKSKKPLQKVGFSHKMEKKF